MPHLNYVKCINGVPVLPREWTLDPKYIPEVEGVTWEPFDTETISPKEISDELVDGKVVLDPVRRGTRIAEKALNDRRTAAVIATKESAVRKASWEVMTSAERKVVLQLVPTDGELGI